MREDVEILLIILLSLSAPLFQVINNQIRPVSSSTTEQGFPHVFNASFQTRISLLQLLPLLVERFRTRSISPLSPPSFRPSAKAMSVPFVDTTTEGMR